MRAAALAGSSAAAFPESTLSSARLLALMRMRSSAARTRSSASLGRANGMRGRVSLARADITQRVNHHMRLPAHGGGMVEART